MKLFFKKVSTLTLTLVGVSQREARETGALPRFSRTAECQEGGFPKAGRRASGVPSQSRLPPCQLPRRGRRDLALRKLLVAHILGSPLGGAVAVRRLRGQAASLTGRSRGYRPYGRVRPGRWFLFRLPPIRARSRLFEKRRPKNFYARFARPTPCAHVRYPLDEHERRRAAQGANCLGCNPRARALFSR